MEGRKEQALGSPLNPLSSHLQRASGEGHHLKSKRPNPCAYTPPSLKGTTPAFPGDRDGADTGGGGEFLT